MLNSLTASFRSAELPSYLVTPFGNRKKTKSKQQVSYTHTEISVSTKAVPEIRTTDEFQMLKISFN